jgi:glycine/D-amino acid oxidase-like deaminating enzyme
MRGYDTIVVGGGLVGSAIAYGLARHGQHVLVLDEGDVAFRASRGNFGLVWVQGKGVTLPEYAVWTLRSVALWPDLARELCEEVGIDPELEQPGGVRFCLSQEETADRARIMTKVAQSIDRPYPFEILDRQDVLRIAPGLGEAVVGGCFCPLDGHANPLRLLQALHAALAARGCTYVPNMPVEHVQRHGAGFEVRAAGTRYHGERIVLAAGTGTPALAAMIGLDVPVRPQRGQIMVTGRVQPFLDLPTHTLRQTADGGIMIGDSLEEAGFDDRGTPRVMAAIARRAILTFPFLASVRVVRSWAALRVMTADGYPIYQQSETSPGAFVACVHSGVTLAAAHAGPLAAAIAEGRLPEVLSPFSTERFHVQAA